MLLKHANSLRIGFSILCCAIPVAVHGQGVSPSTTDNRVPVRVYVSLSDSVTRYFPVVGHRLLFFRSARDSTEAVTDSLGSVTVRLAPGEYRLVSAAPVGWRGFNYWWNVPIAVRAGMAVIDLQAPDAVTGATSRGNVTPSAAPVAVALSSPGSDAGSGVAPSGYYAYPQSPKDGGLALVLSFLITGGGQMYSGEVGKGVGLLVLSGLGAATTLAAVEIASTCTSTYYGGCNDSSEAGLALVGVSVWLGTWIYSMVDAPSAARRYNAAHGLRVGAVRPVFRQGPRGTSIGVAFSVR